MSRGREILQMVKERKAVSTLAILFTLSLGILIGTLVSRGARAAQKQSKCCEAQELEIPAPTQMSSIFSKITRDISPAVVNINTESTVKPQGNLRRRAPQAQPGPGGQGGQVGPNGGGGEDPFGDFFQKFFDFGQQQQQEFRQKSLGSGVIVDKNGYILTNEHVVSKADKIKVKLHDDPKMYDAKLVGEDKDTDLAVIKIQVDHPLTVAKLGNSNGLNVGDWVLAVGSPFGLDETVTAGIISAKGRDLGGSQFQRFVQTDAAINPGNSGGPLLNMAGEVIGINTAIATETGSYAGVGFALPSNMAIGVYNQLIKNGKVTRGSVGITFQPEQSPVLLRSFGVDHGVVITGVQADGPAGKAGLKQGDVILSLNGTPVKDGDDLVAKIAGTPVGDSITVRFMRDHKEQEAKVITGDRSKVFADLLGPADEEGQPEKGETEAKFGITIQNINPESASRLGLGDVKGVIVTNVDNDSFADDIGLMRQDVILQINQQPILKVDDVLRIQKSLKPKSDVVFLVQRNQRGQGQATTLYLAGSLP